MGVPSLFRWFARAFPGVVRKPHSATDECDNLYVDANSIVHNACHPQDRPAPPNEEAMLVDVGRYLDCVIKTANPKKVILIALDGVAPQAKINQQRARRFRAAKDAREARAKKAAFLQRAREQGFTHYNQSSSNDGWDSNTITPGTPFMAKLDLWLESWIMRKFEHEPEWADLTVVFSGSRVPGEGEHKAMDFIRRQRQQEGYKPLRHVFYGPDADLILLALATHEPDFRIVREDPTDNRATLCSTCKEFGHAAPDCNNIPNDWIDETQVHSTEGYEYRDPKLVFFDIHWLRGGTKQGAPWGLQEYLKFDVGGYDFERALDDFILLVTLLGNDFLPALPLPDFEIHKDAITKVVEVWKETVPAVKGYLTKDGTVRTARLGELMSRLAIRFEPWAVKGPDQRQRDEETAAYIKKTESEQPVSERPGQRLASQNPQLFNTDRRQGSVADTIKGPVVHEDLGPEFNGVKLAKEEPDPPVKKRALPTLDSDNEGEETKGRPFYTSKMKYYSDKFGARANNPDVITGMATAYTYGLVWVMGYYTQGKHSWTWAYPELYAPYPSDFGHIPKLEINFGDSGHALLPFEQLMSVFPPQSASHIPLPFQTLMLEDTDLKHYYPEDFEVDLNGHKASWKGVAKLPFIDTQVLRIKLSQVWNDVTKWDMGDRNRNRHGFARLLVKRGHNLYPELERVQRDPRRGAITSFKDLDFYKAGFGGQYSHHPKFMDIWKEAGLATITEPRPTMVSVIYKLPAAKGNHLAVVLPNQPPIARNYRLVSRLRRPLNKKVRYWIDPARAENAGRTAEAVVAEVRRCKELGVPVPTHAQWSKARFTDPLLALLGPDEDETDTAATIYEALPADFDGMVMPVFPTARGDLNRAVDDWSEDEDDDPTEETVNQFDNMSLGNGVHQPGNRIVVKQEEEDDDDANMRYTDDSDDDSDRGGRGQQRNGTMASRKAKQAAKAQPQKQNPPKAKKQKTTFTHKPIEKVEW